MKEKGRRGRTEELESGGHDAVESGLGLEFLVVHDRLAKVVHEDELRVRDTVLTDQRCFEGEGEEERTSSGRCR